MSDDLSQYKDLYLQTSREYLQALNDSLLRLEKNPADPSAIDEIFRSAHSLKSQSAAMGYVKIGYLCHTIEDVFYEIKQNRLTVTPELADILFRAFDNLTKSIDSIEQQNQETDLSAQAEELKKQTGVTTSGAGKSQRDTAATQTPSVAPTAPAPAPLPTPEPSTSQKVKTITLPVEQLDAMMNLIEDLTVHTLRMHTFIKQINNGELTNQYDRAGKILQNLQYEVMKARLIPISVVLDHFPRTIRDLARADHKEVDIKILDDNLAIDRAIVERIDEPLTHLLRNAVSHGISQNGTITITTKKERDWAVIAIHDNGRGIDWEKLKRLHADAGLDPGVSQKDLLFAGISTADTVTSVSGRGVGMKAVREAVESFGGDIEVQSTPTEGTTFTLRFPLSLAISKVLLFLVGKTSYAMPVNTVDRIVTVTAESLKTSADQEVFVLDKTEVPLLRLDGLLGDPANTPRATNLNVVVTLIEGEKVGLVVDRLVNTVDAIVKPLPETLQDNKLFMGTTILESGQTTLIINPQALSAIRKD